MIATMYLLIISEAGDLKTQACYLDAWDSTWKSCSELCRTDRIQASTSQRMKCRDYCPCEYSIIVFSDVFKKRPDCASSSSFKNRFHTV